MTGRRKLELLIGATLAPEVRVAGTVASEHEVVPSREYLERFPPALVVAFGRTPAGARSPEPLLARVRATCEELGHAPPIAACDLEQGAGLHFDATRLPPALALASAGLAGGEERLDWIAAAAELTAREARARGVELVLAPVADVNTRHDNPIIAVRSFGDDPRLAAERATAFAVGLRAGGAGACAKHFPGHGDTSSDSHLVLPRVARDAAGLREVELAPFRRLVEHGVETVMVAHLDVPALTGEPGLPCTLSARAVEVLRRELGFRGVVLSDAMSMGALSLFEPRYARALAAGCDALLCPEDPASAAEELLSAVEDGRLDVERLAEAAERVAALRSELSGRDVRAPAPREAEQLARRLADRALRISRPWSGALGAVLDTLPAAETDEISAAFGRLRSGSVSAGGKNVLVPVVCEARAGRGRYALSSDELGLLERRLADLRPRSRPVLAWFGSPQSLPRRLWEDPGLSVVVAFAPTPPMVEAVARACEAFARGAQGTATGGSLPSAPG